MTKVIRYIKNRFRDNPVIQSTCEIAEKNPSMAEELLHHMIKYIIHELNLNQEEVIKLRLELEKAKRY